MGKPPMPNVLAIDFDDTLCHTSYKGSKWVMGMPFKATIYKVNELSKTNEIIIFTARPRAEWPDVNRWLVKNKVNYHKIMAKPLAKIYVDDRAMTPQDFLDNYGED